MTPAISSLVRIWKISHLYPGCSFVWKIRVVYFSVKHSYIYVIEYFILFTPACYEDGWMVLLVVVVTLYNKNCFSLCAFKTQFELCYYFYNIFSYRKGSKNCKVVYQSAKNHGFRFCRAVWSCTNLRVSISAAN